MSELEIEQQNAMPENGKMVLRTENLVKKYGKRTVVSHVSFDVKQGRLSVYWGRTGQVRLLLFI